MQLLAEVLEQVKCLNQDSLVENLKRSQSCDWMPVPQVDPSYILRSYESSI